MTNTPALNPMRPRRVKLRASLLSVPILTLGLASVPFTAMQAADGTWNTNTNSNWNTTTTSPWLNGIIAQGADSTAYFKYNITSPRTVTLTESLTIGNLYFEDITTSSNDWTLARTNSAVLTLQTTSGTPTITVAGGASRSATISAVLDGNQGLTKAGTGTLVLSGSNTYTGTTAINAGTLTLSGSINSSSALALGGGTLNYTPTTGGSTQTFGGTTVNLGSSTITNATSGNTVDLGAITQNAGGLLNISSLTGTTTTSTANTNGILGTWATTGSGATLTYVTGGGTIAAYSGGTAAATAANVTDTTGTLNYNVAAGGTLGAGASVNTLRYTGATGTIAGPLTANGLMNAGTNLVTYTGGVTIGADNELVIVSNSGGIAINSVISGSGSVISGGVGTTVASSGTAATGLVTLAGANEYNGGTFINSGALRASHSSALGTGAVTVMNGAQLQLHSGITVNNTININGTSALFSSTNAGGTPNLTGTVNLQSNSGISLATNSGNAVMTLSGTVNLNGNILTASTQNVTTGPAIIISGVINGSGGITTSGAGRLLISGDNSLTYSGTTNLNSGVLELGSDGALGSGVLAFKPGNSSASANIRTSTAEARTSAAAVTIAGADGTSRYLFGSTSASFNGGLTFTNTAAISLSSGQKLFEVANRTQFDAGFTGSGGITMQTTGATGLGTLVLNGANTYTGATTINAGTLQIGSGGATGSVAGAITNNSALVFKRSDSYTVGNEISGSGSVTQDGTGTLIFSTDNTYTGTTTINQGTLQIGNGETTGTLGTGAVTNNSALVFNRSNSYTVGNAISGTGSVTQAGSGTTTLTGANSYSGGTTINAGTLALSGSGSLGSGTVTVAGGTLDLGAKTITNTFGALTGGAVSNGTITNSDGAFDLRSGSVGAILAGTNGLTKTTSGTVSLAGANSYTGATLVEAGTLALGLDASLASTVYNISAGGTFDVSEKSDYSLVGISTTIAVSGSSIGLFDAGAGVLTYGGALNVTFDNVTPSVSQSWQLFSFGSQSGSFDSLTVAGTGFTATVDGFAGTIGGVNYTFTYADGTLAASAIPEPSTYAAIAGALALGAVLIRRRRRVQA